MIAGREGGFGRAVFATALALAALAALVVLTPAARSAATPPLIWEAGHNCGDQEKIVAGECSAADETFGPSGMVSDPATGNLLVADQNNHRIQEWSPWGVFIRSWGWGVRDGSAEAQVCTAATGCQQGLAVGAGGQTNPISLALDSAGDVYVGEAKASTVQEDDRVQEFDREGHFLRTWGAGVVSGGAAGTGTLVQGSDEVTSLVTTAKTFLPGQTVSGTGIPAGTTIIAVGLGALRLSDPATASGTGVVLTAPEGAGNVPTDERQVVAVEGSPTGGSFTLTLKNVSALGKAATRKKNSNQLSIAPTGETFGSPHLGDRLEGESEFPTGAKITAIDTANGTLTMSEPSTTNGTGFYVASETTAPLAFDAGATEVEEALEGLPAIGAGGVTVTGPAGGPYSVIFGGPLLEDVNMPRLGAASSLAPAGAVTVTTATEGAGAAEICEVPASCQPGTGGTGPGQFSAPGEGQFSAPVVAVFTAGTATSADDVVYVGDRDRIEKFDTEGHYIGQIALPQAGRVRALAVDNDPGSPDFGDLYFSYVNDGSTAPTQPGVFRIDPGTGAVLETLEVATPMAITVAEGGEVYVFDGVLHSNTPFDHEGRILQFDSAGTLVGTFLEGELNEFEGGLTTGSACGIEGSDLYFSAPLLNFVRAYGPPPHPDICPPPAVPPTIGVQQASQVGAEDATLVAQVNPHFWPDTTYYVEYGTGKCSEGACGQTVPSPGTQLPGGVQNAPITTPGVQLSGLRPATTYHYRFVARSSGGGPVFGIAPSGGAASEGEGLEGSFHTFAPSPPKVDCPNQGLRAGPSAHLPDCRAYELVSPTNNGGGITVPAEGHDLSSPEGDAVTFTTLAAGFGDPASTPFAPQYMSARNPSLGWQTQAIDPPRALPSLRAAQNVNFLYRAFSPDLCEGWLEQDTEVALTPGAPVGVPNYYRRTGLHEGCPSSSAYELLTTTPPPGFGIGLEPTEVKYFPEIQGMSADGRTTLVRANAKLTDNASTADLFQLYAANGGSLHLVSVLPDGEPSPTQASAGSPQGALGSFKEASVDNAISEDGQRVFWTACHTVPGGEECGPPTRVNGHGGCAGHNLRECQRGSLYVRVRPLQAQSKVGLNGCTQPARACTYVISEEPETRFLGATPSGSGVIYLAGENLFVRNVSEVISEGPGAAPVHIAGGVSGTMGFSRDLSRIYLESTEVCGTNAGANGSHATAGSPNLYLYESGQSCGAGDLRYIATLGPGEAGVNETGGGPEAGNSPIHPQPSVRTSRVSTDGTVAIFTSAEPLTGITNNDVASGKPDAQVFLFDAGQGPEGKLVCLSCSPTGAAPTGQSVSFSGESWVSGAIPGWIDEFHAGNALADGGGRVFFESFSRLTPGDRNDQRDVYEWEAAAGEAQCLGELGSEVFVPASGGCLSLISSGEGDQPSFFVDASTDGRDVFIATSSSLVPQDPGFRDIYDARELGGFPPPDSAIQGCASGDECRQAVAPPPSSTPGSQVAGPGNPAVHSKVCPKNSPTKGKGKKKNKKKSGCRSSKPQKHKKHRKHKNPHRGGQVAHKAGKDGGAK